VVTRSTHTSPKKTILRNERRGKDVLSLWASLDAEGSLRIEGQDLGPTAAIVSPDAEYEWIELIEAADIPRLVELLGGIAGTDILTLLEERFTGRGSYEFERLLRESDVPVKRFVI
jgi:hypothetical protein